FNGTSNALNVASFTIGATFTLETWVNSNDISAGVYHAYMDSNFLFGNAGHRWLGQDGSLFAWDGQNTEFDFGTISANTWYHVVATYDNTQPPTGGTLKLYVNGALLSTQNPPSPAPYGAVTATFGLAYTRAIPGEYFNGILDEARVSKVARSADWIKVEYNNMNGPWLGAPNWSAVSTGITTAGSAVNALAVNNGGLYVGGTFIDVGSANGDRIVKWDGAAWSALSTGIGNGAVNALAVYNNELYAGGSFSTVDGVGITYLARWNGSTWSNVGGN